MALIVAECPYMIYDVILCTGNNKTENIDCMRLEFKQICKNSKKSDNQEIAERIARDTRVDMKLDEISTNVRDVKETVKNIQNDIKDHEGRIVKLESSYKAEHKRLDELFLMVESKTNGGNHDE